MYYTEAQLIRFILMQLLIIKLIFDELNTQFFILC